MSENEPIKTAFHEIIAAQGGSHVEDGGWMWLEGFGDVAKGTRRSATTSRCGTSRRSTSGTSAVPTR